MLEVTDVHTYYGRSHILRGVSLRVQEASVVGVLGRNGVGKTTLMRSIMGLVPPRRGTIRFGGREIQGMAAHEISRHGLALVPQGHEIFPSLSVWENLWVAERRRDTSPSDWGPEEVYAQFPRLRPRLRQPGTTLSGGEQQMLAVGRALMANPSLVLLDEPTEGLAPSIVKQLGELIAILRKQGRAILLVEQRLQFALDVSDYVYVMSKGEVVHDGPAEGLATNAGVKQRYLGLE